MRFDKPLYLPNGVWMNVDVSNDSLQSKLHLLREDLSYGVRRIDYQYEIQRFVRASDANWNYAVFV